MIILKYEADYESKPQEQVSKARDELNHHIPTIYLCLKVQGIILVHNFQALLDTFEAGSSWDLSNIKIDILVLDGKQNPIQVPVTFAIVPAWMVSDHC